MLWQSQKGLIATCIALWQWRILNTNWCNHMTSHTCCIDFQEVHYPMDFQWRWHHYPRTIEFDLGCPFDVPAHPLDLLWTSNVLIYFFQKLFNGHSLIIPYWRQICRLLLNINHSYFVVTKQNISQDKIRFVTSCIFMEKSECIQF